MRRTATIGGWRPAPGAARGAPTERNGTRIATAVVLAGMLGLPLPPAARAQEYVLVDANGNDIGLAGEETTGSTGTPVLSAFPWLRLDDLTATRERPLFTPGRAPPAREAPVAAEPEPEPEPEPVAESEPPPLRLAGVVAGGSVSLAMLEDAESQEVVRLAPGQSVSDWILVSVEPRAVTLRQGDREVRLLLASPDDAAAAAQAADDAD